VAAVVLGLFVALAQVFVDVSVAQMLLLIFVVLFIQIRPQGVVSVKSRALDA
jgi:urea transport system permease protein